MSSQVDTAEASIGSSHRTLRQRVAEEIHALIRSGELKPGERLVEDRLAEALGVSRNPVREAIRLLEATGLVEVRPRRGAYVATVDVDDLRQLLEVRSRLEGFAAELAALRGTPDDVAAVRRWVSDGRAATKEGDVVRAAECHRSFHREIERIAGNRYLTEVTQPLLNRTELVFSILLDQRGGITWSEHDSICEALEARDPEAARAAVEHHLGLVAEGLDQHDPDASA